MSEMDTGQVADAAPPPTIETSEVDSAPENLFADETAESTELTANAEDQDETVDGRDPEAIEAEAQQQRALFDKLKLQYEPDSPNMQALAAQVKDFKAKNEVLKAFEPLAAFPEVAQAVQSLATGAVSGTDAWKAVEAIVLPGTIENLKEEALYYYLGNPTNEDVIAKKLLGQHMSADVLKRVAAAIDPVKGYMTAEDLLDQIQEQPDSYLSESDRAERTAWRAEQAAVKADREAITTERQRYDQQVEQTAVQDAEKDIFTHVEKPVDEIEVLYGFTANENDPPEIKALKEEAREFYRGKYERLRIQSSEIRNSATNILAMLSQGSKLKDRAFGMYAPTLQSHVKALAMQSARSTNQFIKARLNEIKAGLGKAQTAPNEVGSLSATGSLAGNEMSRIERATAAYNALLSGR